MTACSGDLASPETWNAVESSFINTMRTDDVFMRNCKKVSAGLLFRRCEATDVIKSVKVIRQLRGNVDSDGNIGSYQ